MAEAAALVPVAEENRYVTYDTHPDRYAHWTMAIVWVSLAITGLIITFGKTLLLPILGHMLMGEFGLIIGSTLFLLQIVIVMVVTSATRGIFVAALYRYATTGEAAPGFYRQNFTGAFR